VLIQHIAGDKSINRLYPDCLAQWHAYYRNTVALYVLSLPTMRWSHSATET
jgi:hypothetical protein